MQQDARRDSRSANVCYQVRCRNALHPAKRIHQVQQRDQQQPLPQKRKHHCTACPAHGLQQVGCQIGQTDHRAAQNQINHQLRPQTECPFFLDEHPDQGIASGKAGRPGKNTKNNGQQDQVLQKLLQALCVACAVAVRQKRLTPHADRHGDHTDDDGRLACCRHGCDRRRAVGHQQPVAEGGGKPCQQAADSVGQTNGQQLTQHLRLFQGRTRINGQHRAVFDDVAQVAGSRHKIAQHTGGSRTADTKVQHQNEQRIKNAVDQRAQKITDHALFYCALCTHQHRHAVGQDKKRRTQCQNLKIPLRIGKNFCIGAQHPQKRHSAHQQTDADQNAQKKAGPEAERGADLALLDLPRAKAARDDGTAACAKHRGHRRKNREHRPDDGDCRHLCGVAQTAHKKHICHVVQHHDKDNDNGGHRHGNNGLPDGAGTEKCFVFHDLLPKINRTQAERKPLSRELSERLRSQVVQRIQQCVQCRFRQTQHGADLAKGHTVGSFCLLIVSKTGHILLHDGFCSLIFHQRCNGALAVQLTIG